MKTKHKWKIIRSEPNTVDLFQSFCSQTEDFFFLIFPHFYNKNFAISNENKLQSNYKSDTSCLKTDAQLVNQAVYCKCQLGSKVTYR